MRIWTTFPGLSKRKAFEMKQTDRGFIAEISGPRRKRLSRIGRLRAGRIFMQQYAGENLLLAYRKWFAVSSLCAAVELNLLGQEISGAVNHAEWRKMKKGNKLAGKETAENHFTVPDEYFAFLAGFAATELPHTITWKERPKTKIGKKKFQKVKSKKRS